MRSRTPPPSASAEAEPVERAAATLSTLEREVLALSAGHGFRNAEIADQLGISERRAERILARALCKFARAMEDGRRPWWRFWSR